MKNKKNTFKFNFKGKYIAHLVFILLTMFMSYRIGDYIFGFQDGSYLVEMFVWFMVVLYLADNLWEYLFKI